MAFHVSQFLQPIQHRRDAASGQTKSVGEVPGGSLTLLQQDIEAAEIGAIDSQIQGGRLVEGVHRSLVGAHRRPECRVRSLWQGASLAMEDAVTLAQCLRDLPDTRSALVGYEQMRRPRVERIVAWAARMNSNKIPGPMLRTVRDLVLPMLLKRQGGADAQGWIFNYRIEWDARVTLGEAA